MPPISPRGARAAVVVEDQDGALPPPLVIDLEGSPRLEIDPPVLQAPMVGITTFTMRGLAEEQGCGLTISEWVDAAALVAGVPSARHKLARPTEGRPFGVQLLGRDPQTIERAARLVTASGAVLVDLNMGCPGKRLGAGCGATLMREPELAEDLVRAAVEGTRGAAPVTVKMRAGWDAADKNAPELAARVVAAGARMVTVHGRTRRQRYAGEVDLEIIRRVKQAVDVPVVANGDIIDIPSMVRTFAETGADAVMVGRAALGNPWLFAELSSCWRQTELPRPPSDAERLQMYLRHLELEWRQTEQPLWAVIRMRKFARWYLQGAEDQVALRREINRLERIEDVRALVSAYLESRSARSRRRER